MKTKRFMCVTYACHTNINLCVTYACHTSTKNLFVSDMHVTLICSHVDSFFYVDFVLIRDLREYLVSRAPKFQYIHTHM